MAGIFLVGGGVCVHPEPISWLKDNLLPVEITASVHQKKAWNVLFNYRFYLIKEWPEIKISGLAYL
ncbi:MAG: hypothetical protein H7Z13_08345 [Ferruginibacter sp.]|nr:hypothetical protein [Ferruginibacter sp.]